MLSNKAQNHLQQSVRASCSIYWQNSAQNVNVSAYVGISASDDETPCL